MFRNSLRNALLLAFGCILFIGYCIAGSYITSTIDSREPEWTFHYLKSIGVTDDQIRLMRSRGLINRAHDWSIKRGTLFYLNYASTVGQGVSSLSSRGARAFAAVFFIPGIVLLFFTFGKFARTINFVLSRFQSTAPVLSIPEICNTLNSIATSQYIDREVVLNTLHRVCPSFPLNDRVKCNSVLKSVSLQNNELGQYTFNELLLSCFSWRYIGVPYITRVVLFSCVLVLHLLFCGVALANLEGWGYGDSMWFCFMTLTTVGHDEYMPETTGGSVIYFYLVLMGVSTAILLVGDLKRLREAAAVRKTIAKNITPTAFMSDPDLFEIRDVEVQSEFTFVDASSSDDDFKASRRRDTAQSKRTPLPARQVVPPVSQKTATVINSARVDQPPAIQVDKSSSQSTIDSQDSQSKVGLTTAKKVKMTDALSIYSEDLDDEYLHNTSSKRKLEEVVVRRGSAPRLPPSSRRPSISQLSLDEMNEKVPIQPVKTSERRSEKQKMAAKTLFLFDTVDSNRGTPPPSFPLLTVRSPTPATTPIGSRGM